MRCMPMCFQPTLESKISERERCLAHPELWKNSLEFVPLLQSRRLTAHTPQGEQSGLSFTKMQRPVAALYGHAIYPVRKNPPPSFGTMNNLQAHCCMQRPAARHRLHGWPPPLRQTRQRQYPTPTAAICHKAHRPLCQTRPLCQPLQKIKLPGTTEHLRHRPPRQKHQASPLPRPLRLSLQHNLHRQRSQPRILCRP